MIPRSCALTNSIQHICIQFGIDILNGSASLYLFHHFAGIADGNAIGRDILCHDATGTYDGIVADVHLRPVQDRQARIGQLALITSPRKSESLPA